MYAMLAMFSFQLGILDGVERFQAIQSKLKLAMHVALDRSPLLNVPSERGRDVLTGQAFEWSRIRRLT